MRRLERPCPDCSGYGTYATPDGYDDGECESCGGTGDDNRPYCETCDEPMLWSERGDETWRCDCGYALDSHGHPITSHKG